MPATQQDPLQHMIRSAFRDVTPVRLRLLLFAGCLTVVVFCLVSVATIKRHQYSVRTVGRDASPSVIAAHQIQIGLEQLDASLANELLYAPGQQEGRQNAKAFDEWRVRVSKQLVAAAENITYGAAEQEPIENIQIALGQYEMQAQRARDMHEAGKDEDALAAYRDSLRNLNEKLLPNTEALNKANADELENRYSRRASEAALSGGLVLVLGMILVVLLVITQVYLTRRFRRRLNLPLVVATACTALLVQHVYSALRTNAHHLKVAKEDSYDSVVALLRARANAYNANAAQSRWLLDREGSDTHKKSFFDSVAKVATFAEGHDFPETISRAQEQLSREEKLNLPGFSGYLADALGNIRFESEGQAVLAALQALSDYCSVDDKMRQAERSGDHGAAVRIGLGYDPGSSKYPFTKFDDALDTALNINRDHFNRAVKAASADLKGLIVLAEIASLLIAICIYLGLRPRMAEYMG